MSINYQLARRDYNISHHLKIMPQEALHLMYIG
jgi:hypothetical protein